MPVPVAEVESLETPTAAAEQRRRNDVLEYAMYIGMDAVVDSDLLWIAEEALQAQEPPGWERQYDASGTISYYHAETGKTLSEHPLDYHYHQLFLQMKGGQQPTAQEEVGAGDSTGAGSVAAGGAPHGAAHGAHRLRAAAHKPKPNGKPRAASDSYLTRRNWPESLGFSARNSDCKPKLERPAFIMTRGASYRTKKGRDPRLTAWSEAMVRNGGTVTGVAIARFIYSVTEGSHDGDGEAQELTARHIMNSQMEAWRVVLLFDTLVMHSLNLSSLHTHTHDAFAFLNLHLHLSLPLSRTLAHITSHDAYSLPHTLPTHTPHL